MFTGLIEAVGEIVAVEPVPSGLRLRLRAPMASELRPGDSLAVNGVCLTVTSATAGIMDADVGPETVRVTTLGRLRSGQVVNLERSMRPDGRFGGHFVQGHVDGTGAVEDIREDAEAHWLTISFGGELAPFVISKGSIAVDGISLTVAALRERSFDVMIVPFTWAHTNVRAMAPGDRVNLECDVIGKYVARAVEQLAIGRGQ